MYYHQDHAGSILIEYKDDHGCYLAVEIVSNILKKAQGQIWEWPQFIDCVIVVFPDHPHFFMVIIPFLIIIWNYLYDYMPGSKMVNQ